MEREGRRTIVFTKVSVSISLSQFPDEESEIFLGNNHYYGNNCHECKDLVGESYSIPVSTSKVVSTGEVKRETVFFFVIFTKYTCKFM